MAWVSKELMTPEKLTNQFLKFLLTAIMRSDLGEFGWNTEIWKTTCNLYENVLKKIVHTAQAHCSQ